jgi:heptaprenyl diphosphate synthase
VNLLSQVGVPRLDEDLERVEAALRRSVGSQDAFLGEVARHLIDAGGKRLRPVLVLAGARACCAGPAPGPADPVPDDVVQGAVSVELVHLGSLYHDDVMDEAESRRGVPSVNARWGNLVAILAGDFLLARASEIAASLGTEVAELLAATIGRLCEGQVAELQQAYNPGRNEAAYFHAIAGKTASLMATSCRIGGLVARAGQADVEALTAFGKAFGMAFQIRDDVLDLVGSDEDLGKPAGHDLVEGVYTLPVIKALASPAVGADLHGILGGPLDPPGREKALDLVRSTDALGASMAVARRYAEEAASALAALEGSEGSGGGRGDRGRGDGGRGDRGRGDGGRGDGGRGDGGRGGSPEAIRALGELAHLLLDTVDVSSPG